MFDAGDAGLIKGWCHLINFSSFTSCSGPNTARIPSYSWPSVVLTWFVVYFCSYLPWLHEGYPKEGVALVSFSTARAMRHNLSVNQHSHRHASELVNKGCKSLPGLVQSIMVLCYSAKMWQAMSSMWQVKSCSYSFLILKIIKDNFESILVIYEILKYHLLVEL